MAMPRPIRTTYDDGRIAHSTTKQRAVQSAAKRLLAGDYWHAIVLENDKEVATLTYMGHDRNKDNIVITLSRRYWK